MFTSFASLQHFRTSGAARVLARAPHGSPPRGAHHLMGQHPLLPRPSATVASAARVALNCAVPACLFPLQHLMRRLDRGEIIRGISLKLQEEERERR